MNYQQLAFIQSVRRREMEEWDGSIYTYNQKSNEELLDDYEESQSFFGEEDEAV